MIRLIPPYVKPGTPYGERRVFQLFENFDNLDGLTVFHSLNISAHTNKREGEADFVVVGHQGLLVIEVKGATRIQRIAGTWRYSNRDRSYEAPESPFDQAKSNYYSLVDAVRRSTGLNLRGCGGYGVIFPNCVFVEESPEWDDAIFLDENNLDDLASFVRNLYEHWNNRRSQEGVALDGASVSAIVEYLRGDFETVESPLTIAKEVTRQIDHLTREQFQFLDLAADNPRLLVKGYAGTGKTLLAIEQAKRIAADGRTVLFLCYNRMLSIGLKLQLAGWSDRITVRTFDSILFELARKAIGNSAKIAISELRQIVYSHREELSGRGRSIDYIVVDEAQDLMSETLIWLMDERLRNGVVGGNWSIFYDDEVQSYLYSCVDGRAALEQLSNYATRLHLNTNCRNPRKLVEDVGRMTQLPIPKHLAVLQPVDPVQVNFYSSQTEQATIVASIIARIVNDGFPAQSITLLFPSSDFQLIDEVYALLPSRINSLIDLSSYYPSTSEFLRFDLQPGNIGFCTVQSFKGLENDVVVLCNLSQIDSQYEKSVLYTGMTRARVRSYLVCHTQLKQKLLEAKTCMMN